MNFKDKIFLKSKKSNVKKEKEKMYEEILGLKNEINELK